MKPPHQLRPYVGKDFRLDADDDALVKMKTLKALFAKIVTILPTPGKNIGVHATSDGPVWGAFSSFGCWQPSALDSTHIKLTPGSITDGTTTFTPDVSSVTISDGYLNYIYLACSIVPDYVDDIVVGGVITSAEIVARTSPETSTNDTGYVLLCKWENGQPPEVFAFWSLAAELLNSGGNVLFRTWVAA